MGSDILKTVGQIAGIGGLAIGVFLLLFRDVIRKNIFTGLTKEQSYRLLRTIIILIWSIALAGIIAWVYVETTKNKLGITVDDSDKGRPSGNEVVSTPSNPNNRPDATTPKDAQLLSNQNKKSPQEPKPIKPDLLLQMDDNDVSSFSLVSIGEGQFIVDHLYVALQWYANCSLRNESTYNFRRLQATSVSTAYSLYLSPDFSEYDLLPLSSPGDMGTWKYTGNDSDEFSIQFDYPPYVLFIVSIEVLARNLRNNQVIHLSSKPINLIRIKRDFGGCLDLEEWYRSNLLKKPKQQSYASEFPVLIQQLLMVDLYRNSSFLEKVGRNRLHKILPQLKQASRKYTRDERFKDNLKTIEEYLSSKSH